MFPETQFLPTVYFSPEVSAVTDEPRDAVLSTKLDAHRNKLATVVSRIKLTTLAMVDVPSRKKDRKIG